MLLVWLSAICVAASATSEQPCFKYNEIHGNLKKSLGETANDCRKENQMRQPEEAYCVTKAYGAADELWGLHCDVYKKFVDEFIYDTTRAERMKKSAIDGCGCRENVEKAQREEAGRAFISCYKEKLHEICPEDKELRGGEITVN